MNENEKRVNHVGFTFIDNSNEFENDLKMEFDCYPDMHISTLHNLCRRFALALGYSESSVNEYFGEASYD